VSISRQIDSGTGKLERSSLRVSTIVKAETEYTEVSVQLRPAPRFAKR